MLPDRVSNPGPLTYESGALSIALRDPASRTRTMSLGYRSRSQSALKFCAQTSVKPVRVRPISVLCMAEFSTNDKTMCRN